MALTNWSIWCCSQRERGLHLVLTRFSSFSFSSGACWGVPAETAQGEGPFPGSGPPRPLLPGTTPWCKSLRSDPAQGKPRRVSPKIPWGRRCFTFSLQKFHFLLTLPRFDDTLVLLEKNGPYVFLSTGRPVLPVNLKVGKESIWMYHSRTLSTLWPKALCF